MSKKLIVNSDDYGHGKLLSEGIRRAHLEGIVTSTTTMMNWPGAVDDLLAAMIECPDLGLGVHLVLTSGKPLLPPEQIPSLVDEHGYFRRPDPFAAHLANLKIAEVEAEWRAQISLFKQTTGLNPDHLDSHHHVSYCSPALFECMLKLAAEMNCAIRFPCADTTAEHAYDYLWTSNPKNDYAHILGLMNEYSPRCPQVFWSNFYDEGATHEGLLDIIQRIGEDEDHETFELMCHPAITDDFLRQVSDYNDKRGEELEILTDPSLKPLLADKGIELISFSGL
jgi:predicted glycoside hydrolase/deacetylase ChbG (UPF0249 family)